MRCLINHKVLSIHLVSWNVAITKQCLYGSKAVHTVCTISCIHINKKTMHVIAREGGDAEPCASTSSVGNPLQMSSHCSNLRQPPLLPAPSNISNFVRSQSSFDHSSQWSESHHQQHAYKSRNPVSPQLPCARRKGPLGYSNQ